MMKYESTLKTKYGAARAVRWARGWIKEQQERREMISRSMSEPRIHRVAPVRDQPDGQPRGKGVEADSIDAL